MEFAGLHILLLWFLVISIAEANKPPNVVFLLADDLGWNDVSFHGSTQIPTPNIDKLGREGIFLNNYYVSPICTPTRGALMTGRHPMQLGLQRQVIVGSSPWGLGLNETIMPQYLKEVGYQTHAVGKWHLGFFAKELTPLYRGFDSYYGYYLGAEDYLDHSAWAGKDYQGLDFRDGGDPITNATGQYSTELFTTRAEKIIANHDISKPLFLYMAHQAVHSGNPPSTDEKPLEAPKKYTDRFPHITDPNRKIFAGMVSALDDSVGNVTKALAAKGLLNNTVIIFSTDNGGPAAGLDMNHANNWPLRGVKSTYWEGGMRATGLVWSPLLEKTGRVSNRLVHVTDWLPTIMHLAGANSTFNKTELYGMNVWDAISRDDESPRDEIVHNYDEDSGAIRHGEYKLIMINSSYERTSVWSKWYRPESSNVSAMTYTVKCNYKRDTTLPPCDYSTSPCLFNVIQDPCEFNNIAIKFPDLVSHLKKKILDFNNRSQTPRNCRHDERGNPIYHGGIWVPWITLKHGDDDRQCIPKEAESGP